MGIAQASLRMLLPVCFLFGFGLGWSAPEGHFDRPNLIIILADDLGWADLSCYGAKKIHTPHLDQMAREGVRFTDFYVPSPVCTPSRASLLTGRYPFRTGLTQVLSPGSSRGLPASEVTLAELLRLGGYTTALIGKWHLGHSPEYLPLNHGFDEYFGIPYSNDMKPLVFVEGDRVHSKEIPVQALLTDIYTSRAVEFLKRHHSKPFFLLISHAMPHFPIDVTHRWKGSSRDGIYGDTIQELDWSVGEILRTLRELELDRRTAVFFTSDNGSWRPRSNGLLRGAKSTTWEGGLRVPLIARYPGNFRTAQVERLPAMMFDLYTTALALAEIAAPTDRIVDGESLLGLLREATEARVTERTPHQPLFFFQNKTACAVRSGEWKLHVARRPLLRKPRKIPPELYNLTLDPGESVNLAERRPEIVQHLLQELEQFYTKELQVPDRDL